MKSGLASLEAVPSPFEHKRRCDLPESFQRKHPSEELQEFWQQTSHFGQEGSGADISGVQFRAITNGASAKP